MLLKKWGQPKLKKSLTQKNIFNYQNRTFIAVLHFTVTVGASIMSITQALNGV
jgi:hypothetical protein